MYKRCQGGGGALHPYPGFCFRCCGCACDARVRCACVCMSVRGKCRSALACARLGSLYSRTPLARRLCNLTRHARSAAWLRPRTRLPRKARQTVNARSNRAPSNTMRPKSIASFAAKAMIRLRRLGQVLFRMFGRGAKRAFSRHKRAQERQSHTP